MADLAYVESGTGPSILFLHGLTASGEQWRPVTDLLEDRYHCVRVDLPGHGKSPDRALAPLEHPEALHSVIDELGLDPPVLVGHSAGAITSTLYAATHGARGVVNVDQPLHLPTFQAMLGDDRERFRDGRFEDSIRAVIDGFGLNLVPEPRRTAARAVMHPRQDVVVAMWNDILVGRAAEIQLLLDAALDAITCPYLAVFGGPPTDDVRASVERIPRADIEVWEGMGHYLFLVDPDRFVTRLEAFVRSL